MSIEKRLRESFSEITPPTDNGTITRNVIERAENMDKNNESRKPRLNRAAITIIAAAAVLAAATVSVGAATGWSFNRAFDKANQTIIEQHGAHEITVYSTSEAEQGLSAESITSGVPGKQAEPFDYLAGGKELDLWYSFDDFKLNIKGVCADDFVAYVLYDIIFDEDFDYSPKAGWTAWDTCTIVDAVDKSLDEQPEYGMVCSFGEGVISQEGNVLHCYVMPEMSDKYTWGGKTMTLDFKSVRRYVPNHSEKDEAPYNDNEELSFGEGGLQVEIPIDFPIFERTTWEINQPVDLAANESNRRWYGDDLPGTVKYFSATPLSYRVYVEADTSGFTKGDSYMFDTSFVIGGETSEKASGQGYTWVDDNGQGETGLFESPVDPADITSISICGQVFELK